MNAPTKLIFNPNISTTRSRNWIGGGSAIEKTLTAELSGDAITKILDAILYGAIPPQGFTEGEFINCKGAEIGNGRSQMLHVEGLAPEIDADDEDEEIELLEFGVTLESKFLEFRRASIVYQPVWRRSGAPLRENIDNKNLGREPSLVLTKVDFGIDYFQGGRISGLLGTAPSVFEGFTIKATPQKLICSFNAENQKGPEVVPCQERAEFKAFEEALLSGLGVSLTQLINQNV